MGVKSSEETIIRENYRGMEKVNPMILYTFSYNTSRGGHPVGMKGNTLKTDKSAFSLNLEKLLLQCIPEGKSFTGLKKGFDVYMNNESSAVTLDMIQIILDTSFIFQIISTEVTDGDSEK